MRWHPKSIIGPPPDSLFFKSHARGWPGGGSKSSKAWTWTSTGRPISPDAISARRRPTTG